MRGQAEMVWACGRYCPLTRQQQQVVLTGLSLTVELIVQFVDCGVAAGIDN